MHSQSKRRKEFLLILRSYSYIYIVSEWNEYESEFMFSYVLFLKVYIQNFLVLNLVILDV